MAYPTEIGQFPSGMREHGTTSTQEVQVSSTQWETPKSMENTSQPVCDFVSFCDNVCPESSVQQNNATTGWHRNRTRVCLVGHGGLGITHLARQYNTVDVPYSLSPQQAKPASDLIAGLRGEYLQNVVLDPISGSRFIPRSAIDRIFTSDSVRGALAKVSENFSDRGQFLENIMGQKQSTGSFSAIFAILVMIGKAHDIKSFVDEGLNDHSLPFVFEQNKAEEFIAFDLNNSHRIHGFSRYWSSDEVREFKKAQQAVVLPVFDVANVLSGQRPVPHLGRCEVLPFTKANRVQSGGTSVVYKISIHGDNCTTEKNTNPGCFALKELRASNKSDYERERQALVGLSKNPHEHVIQLLASFECKGNYYLLLEWADGDLSRLWRLNPVVEPTPMTSLWVAEQFWGIADGLARIHRKVQNRDGSMEFAGWHGDIKPQNILIRRSPNQVPPPRDATMGTSLVLADFGLAKFELLPGAKQSLSKGAGYTRTYRAPECDMTCDQMSAAYDIWSLGCVILETVVWVLAGSTALQDFTNDRANQVDEDLCYSFFESGVGSNGTKKIVVKAVVYDWAYKLSNHQSCNNFIHDLLGVVVERMLVIEANRRSTASEIASILAGMAEKLRHDTTYSETAKNSQTLKNQCSWCRVAASQPCTLGWPFAYPSDTETVEVKGLQMEPQDNPGPKPIISTEKRKFESHGLDIDVKDEQQPAKSRRKLYDWQEELNQTEYRFACPFYKKDPCKLARARACRGPGWSDFHRVKEHVNRTHAPAKHTCSRCREAFKTEELLYKHQRSDLQCPIREIEAMDGMINPDQALSMKSRKKHASNMTDVEKWYELFHILFPSHNQESYPSPYYEPESTVSSYTSIATAGSNDLAEYREYLSQGERQRALEVELERTVGISNQEMCKVLALFIRDHKLQELRQFEEAKLTYNIPEKSGHPYSKSGDGGLTEPIIHSSLYTPIPHKSWADFGDDDQSDWDLGVFGPL